MSVKIIHKLKKIPSMTPKLAVLVSGTGSLFEAMHKDYHLPISLCFADRPCRGLEIARAAAIPTEIRQRIFSDQFDRNRYTLNTIEVLRRHEIGLVVMAGFMTIFSAAMTDVYRGFIVNIHPSLLPAFKGERAVADALKFGVKVTGTTIHFAAENVDDAEGRVIAQEAVPVQKGDTVETLWERIKKVERRLYPETIRTLLDQMSI
ncbi:MAG: phosphoribosylglycinamide formyltransferase 1 [Candidatus Parcubacteria bacterium]|jgi:phosphoribosylglycinamide formyltransferase-1|nr:phosphoribosylglycinamide formyltransferase 1 [Candidatus Parcubacteria bacterium]